LHLLANSFGDDDAIEKSIDKLIEKNVPLDAKDDFGAAAMHYAVGNCTNFVTKVCSYYC
jgi:ankyrin repeat protein